jgi:hypothetical protein
VYAAVAVTFICWLPTVAVPVLIMCGNMQGNISSYDYIGAMVIGVIPIFTAAASPHCGRPAMCRILGYNENVPLSKFMCQSFAPQGVAACIAIVSRAIGLIWVAAAGGSWFSPLAATIGLGFTAALACVVTSAVALGCCYHKVTKHVDA